MSTPTDSSKSEFILIGAGLGRTGTLSLRVALELILPGKCHHMGMVAHHDKEWSDIIIGKMTDDEFRNFFLSNGYVAGVGAPLFFMYERAMAVFPNAKVILTTRDPEKWVKSAESTIVNEFAFNYPALLFRSLGLFTTYLSYFSSTTKPYPKTFFKNFVKYEKVVELKKALREGNGVDYYNKWNEDVQLKVPKEKLLVYSVKEGWGPLCEFLNVPQPDVPFPYINTTEDFQKGTNTTNRRSWLLLYEIITLPLVIGGLYFLCNK